MNQEIEKINFTSTHRENIWINDNLKLAFLCIPKVASSGIRNQFKFIRMSTMNELPEDYQEVTVKPDYEGKMKEVEDGLETVEDITKEVGEKRSKQAGGGIAYLLGE